MKVEAIKREDGLYIPMQDVFKAITQDKIWVELEILEAVEEFDGYAILDQIVGLCQTDQSDASVKHDQRIYRRRDE
jgi:hypothetical protein